MKSFKLDSNGHIDISEQNFQIVSKIDAIAQRISNKLKTFRGEYFLDNRVGLPFFEDIFIKRYNLITIETLLKRTVLDIDEVTLLADFTISVDDEKRELSVSFSATVLDEILTFSEVI